MIFGVVCVSLAAACFVLYLVLPYERYRRTKISLYQKNLREMDDLVANASAKVGDRIREVTPELLTTERRSFTFATPALVLMFVGCAFIVFEFVW